MHGCLQPASSILPKTKTRRIMAKPPRAWQRMLSGRRLDLLDPTPVDIEIEDIAHGLAFVARWNGQTFGDYAYSVAEHSLLVETLFARLCPKATAAERLTALLHDAPEYVIGDMISPVKAAVGPGYGALDDRLTAAIHIRFGLPAVTPAKLKKQIKKADRISAWMEATQIAGFTRSEADKFFGAPDLDLIADLSIVLRAPVNVRNDFTSRHSALIGEMV
jgi:5'-deoxynucleotidase YfbR-like HD superfamily hydrolase